MKWSNELKAELITLCKVGKTNSELAEHFGVNISEIYAKRSAWGVTIPKCSDKPATEKAIEPKPSISAAEYLKKAREICIVNEACEGCDTCPLTDFGCGIPSNFEEIEECVSIVSTYKFSCDQKCSRCGKLIDGRLKNEYQITYCPWCGKELR